MITTRPPAHNFELGASRWQHIFRIFMFVILINKRVYHEDMTMFIQMTKRVRSVLSPNLVLTDRMLKDWFILNREEILDFVKLGQEEFQIKRLMSQLNEVEDKTAIVRAMQAIAKSDGNLAGGERRLITMVAQQWKLAA